MIKKVNLGIIVAAFLVLLPDVFFYPGSFENYLGFAPQIITFILLILSTVFRFYSKVPGGKLFTLYIFFLTPAIIILSIMAQMVDFITYTNFTFSTISIHPAPVFDLAVLMPLFAIPLFDKKELMKNWKLALFIAGILGFSFFVFLKWRLPDIFYTLDKEDSLLEYATAAAYLATSIIAVLAFLRCRKLHVTTGLKKTWLLFLMSSAILAFFVAGEEISWGQRILNIPTPDKLELINNQSEITVHNIEAVFGYVYDAYLALGYYGALSWLLVFVPFKIKGIKIVEYFKPVISKWYLIPYFAVIIGYVIWRYQSTTGAFDIWEETAEIFPAVGVLIIFIEGYFFIKNHKPKRT